MAKSKKGLKTRAQGEPPKPKEPVRYTIVLSPVELMVDTADGDELMEVLQQRATDMGMSVDRMIQSRLALVFGSPPVRMTVSEPGLVLGEEGDGRTENSE